MRFRSRFVAYFLTLFLIMNLIPNKTSAMSASAAILMDQESGRVLYQKNAHTQMRIASITKIMTAIIAIENGELEKLVTVSKNAAGTEGSSIYLKPGDKLKLEDLLYGLMLRSGNDAAVAIAEHVGGSLEEFVKLMNKKAKELGMKQTIFANPHGLDDHENHYSTAYDMALLTKYAQNNREFSKIFGTKVYKCDKPNGEGTFTWRNKNRLLTGMYKYSTGGKTGYTVRAKRTLVSTAENEDLNLIAVTLNAPDDWNDHISLFNQAFKKYDRIEIIDEVKITGIPSYLSDVKIYNTFTYPLTKNEQDKIKTEIRLFDHNEKNEAINLLPPVQIGSVIIYLDNKEIGELPVFIF